MSRIKTVVNFSLNFPGGGVGDAGIECLSPVIAACEIVPKRAELIRLNFLAKVFEVSGLLRKIISISLRKLAWKKTAIDFSP